MQNISELVGRLIGDIEVMKEAMLKKEKKLAALFKNTSKIMSDYEKETESLVEKLRKARIEQVVLFIKDLSIIFCCC